MYVDIINIRGDEAQTFSINTLESSVSRDTGLRCDCLVRSESSRQMSTETRRECRTQQCAVRLEKQRERGTWWDRRRTGGVKHRVTVYIPPRRHVAQTEEHQPPSLAEFTRQGHVYYPAALRHHLITLHYLHILHNTCHILLLK